jgi:HD-GYP domain-containing protein (c-di-GMP phosphodiesterase class II)
LLVLVANPPLSSRRRDPAGRDAAWELLDHFTGELQRLERGAAQLRAAFQTVRVETSADLVFLFKAGSGEAAGLVGTREVPLEWCRAVGQHLIATVPPGRREALCLDLADLGDGQVPRPTSAALLRLRESRPDWIVALRLGPRRPLGATDLKVLSVVGRLLSEQTRHTELYDRLKDTLFGLVRCLSATIDAKDPYTCGHSERVARIAVRLGQELRLSQGEISDLYLAGLLHDVGKIGIRDLVLSKSGPLTDEERAHMQEHPLIGDRIVSNVKQLTYLRPGVRNHHERYDGGGYPDGLTREAIPQMARIIAVADSCDAMLSARRYRPALPPSRAEIIMAEGAGSQWDPHYIAAFMACRHEIFSVCHRGLGQSVYTAVERAARTDSEALGSRAR